MKTGRPPTPKEIEETDRAVLYRKEKAKHERDNVKEYVEEHNYGRWHEGGRQIPPRKP